MPASPLDITRLCKDLSDHGMQDWAESLPEQVDTFFAQLNHGDYPSWVSALEQLPKVTTKHIDLSKEAIEIGQRAELSKEQYKNLYEALTVLKPWRKGPFNFFGVDLDTEWRSNWKWNRLIPHVSSLKDKTVLDIGCGNGYYLMRCIGEGAKFALGVDPFMRFIMQFLAFKQYMPEQAIDILPFGIDNVPKQGLSFDAVFSMGVLYHRKNPQEHIEHLYGLVSEGGELILETLIVDEDYSNCLVPEDRYAMMNNVYAIPSVTLLEQWIEQAGFKNILTVDVSTTSIEEQRVTEWMTFQSLEHFLDPNDHGKTVEGYPAPKRAIVIADKN